MILKVSLRGNISLKNIIPQFFCLNVLKMLGSLAALKNILQAAGMAHPTIVVKSWRGPQVCVYCSTVQLLKHYIQATELRETSNTQKFFLASRFCKKKYFSNVKCSVKYLTTTNQCFHYIKLYRMAMDALHTSEIPHKGAVIKLNIM